MLIISQYFLNFIPHNYLVPVLFTLFKLGFTLLCTINDDYQTMEKMK